MGKKRAKKRICLLLHGACLLAIFLLLTGCALTADFKNKWQGHEHLDVAEKLMIKGDFEGALKGDEEVVRLFPGVSPGDSALFHMGLIRAHPDNPQRDYKKALECFRRLDRDFPRSALKEKARVWIGAIDELTRRESRIKDLEKTVSALENRLKALKEIDINVEEKKRER